MPVVHRESLSAGNADTLCGRWSEALSLDWSEVTCKRCLAKRPAPIPPFTDRILDRWEQGADPLTRAWLNERRRDVDCIEMLSWLDEELVRIELEPMVGDDDAHQPALMTDRDRLRAAVRVALAPLRVTDGNSLAETLDTLELLDLLLTQTDVTLDDIRTIAALGPGGSCRVNMGDGAVFVSRIEESP